MFTTDGTSKKRITPETLLEFQFVSKPLLSPDAAFTAFLVQDCDLENEGYHGNLFVLNMASGETKQLTNEGDVKDYCFLPDGRLLFPCKRGEECKKADEEARPLTAYYVLSPEGGEAVHYATLPLNAGAPKIMQDDLWILTSTVDLNRPDFESMTEDERAKAITEYKNPHFHAFEELPIWWNGRGYLSRKRNTLFRCNPHNGEIKAISPRYYDVVQYDCAFNKIIYNGSEYDVMYGYYRGVNLYDIETETTRSLLPEDVHQTFRPMLLDKSTAIIHLTPADTYDYVHADFYIFDLDSGDYKKLADYDHNFGMSSINCDARLGSGQTIKNYDGCLYYISTEDEGAYIRKIDRDGNVSERLTPDGSADSFDICNGKIVVCGLYNSKISELYLLEEGKKLTPLTFFNDFLGNDYSVVPLEVTNFINSDGWEIRGWVMPPVGYVPGQKYPAILHIHGGPKTAFGDVFHHEMQLWANSGYFVLLCNPRGSDGRGEAFAELNTVMGSIDYDDIMQFTDVCLERYADIDQSKVGVAGGSYGGFMTNWIIGHTKRFAAAVSQRSISNNISMECTSDEGTGFSLTQYGCTIKDGAKKLWDWSPLKYAHLAVTPTLFIHSDQDYRCPLSDGIQMFTAVRREGIDSKLVVFHNEEHGLSRQGRPQNRITRLKEILGWFDKYLK